MTEEQKQKKPGLIKKIFKWIGLGILTLLILLALIYEAPKKLVILLLIILAAFTALPKPARKWFWLSVGAAVLILLIWVFLPEDDTGWRPYTFDEELAALEAKYAVPDEENTALAYYEILRTLDIDSNQPEFFIKSTPSSRDEPWLSKDHPETAEWLKGYQETIEKMIEIARKDKCLFPLITDPLTQEENMQTLSKIRQSVFLLISSANNDIAEGRTDTGIDKYICVLHIARHLYQQPTLLYNQMGSIESLSLQKLNRFIMEGQPTEAQLRLISNSIQNLENNWGTDLRNILDLEKLYAKNMLCCMVYEINAQGKTRFRRGTLASTLGQNRSDTYSRRKCAKLGTIFAWLYIPSSPEKIGEFVDAGFEKFYAMTRPEFDWNQEQNELKTRYKLNYGYMVELMTGLSYPVYFRIYEIYLRYLTLRRGTRILLAIKQYNLENDKWPESLDDIESLVPAEALIDPAGGQFDYENHGERFSLYGKSINIWPQ